MMVNAFSLGWGVAGFGLAGLIVGWLGGVIADRFWPVRPAPLNGRRGRYTNRILGAVATAAMFAVLALTLSPATGLGAWLFYAASGIFLSVVDVRHKLLPNKALLPVFLTGVGLLTVTSGLAGDWAALGRALAGAAVLFAAYLALALISPSGMGMGDVKFSAVVGLFLAYLGWPVLLAGALAGFVIGAMVGLVALIRRRGSTVPFGPAMVAGSFAAVLWASALY
ncbi:A24 family peptidase [Cryobacterium sp. SO2]|uniref:prepilin peptidase n=1 Tax=Cryobacterium sp. SO2 TaxID=1897060 RepID=UPI00223D829E|nr:A24 family peptidase [Cryobacterium sp. SO2]WEO78009.1 A24 family peptidase [Cryobacterium sp. SO2]